MLHVLFLISLSGVLINTHPIDLGAVSAGLTSVFDDPMLVNQEFFGGDMADFDPEQFAIDTRNGVFGSNFVWPGGIIPYEIAPHLSFAKNLIEKAMQHFRDVTCIRFVPRTTETHYVSIVPEKGCWSHVGRRFGRQKLSLGPGCLYLGTIIHELNHAVGFWHEQNRPDRDEYIQVLWENVMPGREHNFLKFDWNEVLLLNESYDIGSIMQYGVTSFSRSPTIPTIKVISGEEIIDVHVKTGLSQSDKQRIKNLYQC